MLSDTKAYSSFINMNQPPILVISCDKYSDLWEPFFSIFWKQWPDCPARVFLGTNHKTYADSRVTSIPVGDDISWTSGVQKMLDHIDSEYVIIFLEDFLINHPVDNGELIRMVQIAKEKQLGCLRLVAHLPLALFPTEPIAEFPGLGVIKAGEPYRVTAQVAIWRIATLRKLLVPGLSAWEFEDLGAQISSEFTDLFWGTYKSVIVYEQCVEKGRWKPEGLEICKQAGIQIDFKSRQAFSLKELQDYYLNGQNCSERYSNKIQAVSEFNKGNRIKGLQFALRFLLKEPFSVQLWIIIIFGMIGPAPIAWLQKKHLQLKLNNAHKSYRRKLTITKSLR